MTPELSIEDIEWLLARAAGFDAGFAFITNFEVLEKNGTSDKILEKISEWEKLRLADRFTDEQKDLMKNIKNEFSLINTGKNEWELIRIYSNIFKHNRKVRQPGEPLYSTFNFDNKGKEQAINFIITATDTDISNIIMELNNYKEINIPVTLHSGQKLKYSGGSKAIIYDKYWNILREIDINPKDFIIAEGEQSLTFDCKFSNFDKNPSVKLEIRTKGETEKITLN
jgi:hypothetical protein